MKHIVIIATLTMMSCHPVKVSKTNPLPVDTGNQSIVEIENIEESEVNEVSNPQIDSDENDSEADTQESLKKKYDMFCMDPALDDHFEIYSSPVKKLKGRMVLFKWRQFEIALLAEDIFPVLKEFLGRVRQDLFPQTVVLFDKLSEESEAVVKVDGFPDQGEFIHSISELMRTKPFYIRDTKTGQKYFKIKYGEFSNGMLAFAEVCTLKRETIFWIELWHII
ncbi:MAG: hypothetical protein JXR76_32845 [Deltaproteobacteria bacterium]|nr:hypothetical protein [Deltaproteobacteria bacterium]